MTSDELGKAIEARDHLFNENMELLGLVSSYRYLANKVDLYLATEDDGALDELREALADVYSAHPAEHEKQLDTDDGPVGLMDYDKKAHQWVLRCGPCGELLRYPATNENHTRMERAWDSHVAQDHGEGNR